MLRWLGYGGGGGGMFMGTDLSRFYSTVPIFVRIYLFLKTYLRCVICLKVRQISLVCVVS